ncbi:MAG: hypothetical protein HC892_00120 [Saprospiraceae bacterium]|nr:hypothetical protein [Saprospiraceae bacterium]
MSQEEKAMLRKFLADLICWETDTDQPAQYLLDIHPKHRIYSEMLDTPDLKFERTVLEILEFMADTNSNLPTAANVRAALRGYGYQPEELDNIALFKGQIRTPALNALGLHRKMGLIIIQQTLERLIADMDKSPSAAKGYEKQSTHCLKLLRAPIQPKLKCQPSLTKSRETWMKLIKP